MIKYQIFQYPMQPLRVVDGDTIVVNIDLGFHLYTEEYIRLAGVDTPEIFGRHAEEKGKLAKLFVAFWISEIEHRHDFNDLQIIERYYNSTNYKWAWEDGVGNFFLRSDKYDQRGKYGRVIGTIYRGNDPISLNQALCANNLEKERS